MCKKLFIAADRELPTIPRVKEGKFFHIRELKQSEEAVRKQLNKKYVYYAGAYEGCSCGFKFDDEMVKDEYDREENKNGHLSLEALFDYLKKNIGNLGEIEMYSCWESDEAEPVEHKALIELSKFKFGSEFSFMEKQLIKVIATSEQT